jgi:hypothetical protein
VHNYYGIHDARYFANAATEYFLVNDEEEVNPWEWETDQWHLKMNCDANRDFPRVTYWETKFTAVSHNMCFRHRARNEEIYENDNNMMDNIPPKLPAQYPNTPHSVLIIEELKTMKTRLHNKLKSLNLHRTAMDINNNKAFRYITEILTENNVPSHAYTSMCLHNLPLKCHNFELQISDVNEVVNYLRRYTSDKPECDRIQYIRISNPAFDSSQESPSSQYYSPQSQRSSSSLRKSN